jgi:hypothetical protein
MILALRALFILGGSLCMLAVGTSAWADGRTKTAVLSPRVPEQRMMGFAGAFERVVRAELDRLKVADIAGTPALKLDDLQLAVGCMGEMPSCLDLVAKQLDVRALLYVSVDRAGQDTVVAISKFDAGQGRDARRVLRRATDPDADNQLLNQVEPMLRELYDLSPLSPGGPRLVGPAQSPAVERPLPLAPMIVGGAGVAVLAAGAIVGLVFNGTASDYKNLSVTNDAQVMQAMNLQTRADHEATAANVLIVLGAAALIVAGVLYFLPMGGE